VKKKRCEGRWKTVRSLAGKTLRRTKDLPSKKGKRKKSKTYKGRRPTGTIGKTRGRRGLGGSFFQ